MFPFSLSWHTKTYRNDLSVTEMAPLARHACESRCDYRPIEAQLDICHHIAKSTLMQMKVKRVGKDERR